MRERGAPALVYLPIVSVFSVSAGMITVWAIRPEMKLDTVCSSGPSDTPRCLAALLHVSYDASWLDESNAAVPTAVRQYVLRNFLARPEMPLTGMS